MQDSHTLSYLSAVFLTLQSVGHSVSLFFKYLKSALKRHEKPVLSRKVTHNASVISALSTSFMVKRMPKRIPEDPLIWLSAGGSLSLSPRSRAAGVQLIISIAQC